MKRSAVNLIDPREYDVVVSRLRNFFHGLGFLEVPVQHRLSILAACEDPRTIAKYTYAGDVWPLPQTGQMWLEYELLTKPHVPGFYCISTSYRQEPKPKPGRHDLIFPMFEFETRGSLKELKRIEQQLLRSLGFTHDFVSLRYRDAARRYGVEELDADHEERIAEDFGPIVFLTHFPQHTSPFWNMKRIGDEAAKIDVVLYGMETIGSAERSTNPDEMREMFQTISEGMYAQILYSEFGEDRVEKELDEFLAMDFFPRCGGGIGLTRMIRAMRLNGLFS